MEDAVVNPPVWDEICSRRLIWPPGAAILTMGGAGRDRGW